MQIILLDKVANLGNLGDIVKVKDGFARNFLIPTRRARRATEANKAEFAARRADLEKEAAAKLKPITLRKSLLDALPSSPTTDGTSGNSLSACFTNPGSLLSCSSPFQYVFLFSFIL